MQSPVGHSKDSGFYLKIKEAQKGFKPGNARNRFYVGLRARVGMGEPN